MVFACPQGRLKGQPLLALRTKKTNLFLKVSLLNTNSDQKRYVDQ